MTSILDEFGRSKYLSLTTYRKDGTAVATPVWHVRDGEELVIVTEADSWKVKRIRDNSTVEITVCDLRGRTAPGAPSTTGTARLLDAAGTETARALLARKYLLSRLGNALAGLLRRRRPPMIGIAVTPAAAG
jgi:PPOX class probable F420-dependent enzyme